MRRLGMRRAVGTVLAVVLAGGAVATGASPAGAGVVPPDPATITLPGTFRDLVVHPTTGQVFVAAGDVVSAFSPDGVLLATVEDLDEASGLALEGDDLYVTLAGAGTISRISTTTYEVTGSWAVGSVVDDAVAVVGGRVWFSHGASSDWRSVGSLDPASGAVTLSVLTSVHQPLLRTSPDRPGELFVGERGLTPARLKRWDVTSSPPVQLAQSAFGAVGGNLRDFRIAPGGATITIGAGSPYAFPQVDAATLTSTGLDYQGTSYPGAVAHAADGTVHVGGSSDALGPDLWVHLPGIPTAVTTIELGFDLAPRGLGLSPDGSALYAASTSNVLRVHPLRMRVDGARLSPVDLGAVIYFELVGVQLHLATGVTIDGVPATSVANADGTELVVLIPAAVMPGTREVVVDSELGSTSTSVTFVARCDGRDATIVGSPFPDDLVGTSGPDVIVGRGGDDTIDGRGGDDVICGGEGHDRITAGTGHDVVFGGAGDDTIDGGAGNDLLHGGTGADTIKGGAGIDGIDGGIGDDTLRGGPDTDIVVGDAGHDRMWGGDGLDVLFGGIGNDEVVGGAGNDHLDGGTGHDVLLGSQGDDTLLGGSGDDTLRGQTGTDHCDGGPDVDVHGGCETRVGFP